MTWMETFHPEAAAVDLGTRATSSSSESTTPPEDRWGVVWAEAYLVSGDEPHAGKAHDDEPSIVVEPIVPVTTVVADEETMSAVTYDGPSPESAGGHSSPTSAAVAYAAASSTRPSRQCPRGHCFDTTLGFVLLVSAVASVFGLELSAVLVYALSCGFYRFAMLLQRIGGPLWLLSYVFLLVVQVLQFTDTLLLSLSVFLTELLAGIAYGVCAPFGGCEAARDWHQHVRKLCHLTRWAFRGFHQDWTPQRQTFGGALTPSIPAPSADAAFEGEVPPYCTGADYGSSGRPEGAATTKESTQKHLS